MSISELSAGIYTLTVTDADDCIKIREVTINDVQDCTTCVPPTAMASAVQATCTGGSVNNDASLQLTGVTDADKVNWSLGNTYTGDPDYANATVIGDLPYTITSGLDNPNGSQEYTIRVFSATECYEDFVVTLNEQSCGPVCSCEEYLYVNEVDNGGRVHKFKVNADGSLVEINPENTWYPNGGQSELPSPHGLGTDLNGYLYIGSTFESNGNIRKLDCDGNIFPVSDFEIGPVGTHNIFSIGNNLYVKRGDGILQSYDLCYGEMTGEVCLDAWGSNGYNGWPLHICLLYTSPSPRDATLSRMPSSA